MIEELLHWQEPRGELKPIIVSSPHSGVKFPKNLQSQFKSSVINKPEDTDWYIDRLYEFAPDLGIGVVSAQYSRYVVDLNRDPKGHNLYDDGRNITTVLPTTTFSGKSIYQLASPGKSEIDTRLVNYFDPYYQFLRERLGELREKFSHVLLFDAHSIKKNVPQISIEPIPDLVLGDNSGQSAHPLISRVAQKCLSSQSSWGFSYNSPFRGGFITRSLPRPQLGWHGLQLEMSQSNYMDAENEQYDRNKAKEIQKLLKKLFDELCLCLERMP